jgi:quinol monooxygenase YgiN
LARRAKRSRLAVIGGAAARKWEVGMYAAIRQVKAKPGMEDALRERLKGAVAVVSNVPGFMNYYVVYSPDDTLTAISIFNTVEQAQESNRRALAWIEKYLAGMVVGPASATAGPVIAHAAP